MADDVPADLEVGVCRVLLGMDQHGARGRDGRDDVDVAARAEPFRIPGQPAGKPDDVAGAEGPGQFGLDVGLAEPGVAARIQLHRLGDEDRAFAVHVDAAALVHQRRDEVAGPRAGRDGRCHERVLVPGGPVLAAPAVEDPVHGAEPAGVVQDERGADVPHPGVVQRGGDHLDVGVEVAGGGLDVVRGHQHGDRLEFDDGVRDGGPDGAGGVGFCRCLAQGVAAGGERHPDAVLGRRFGGHPPRAHAVAFCAVAS